MRKREGERNSKYPMEGAEIITLLVVNVFSKFITFLVHHGLPCSALKEEEKDYWP